MIIIITTSLQFYLLTDLISCGAEDNILFLLIVLMYIAHFIVQGLVISELTDSGQSGHISDS